MFKTNIEIEILKNEVLHLRDEICNLKEIMNDFSSYNEKLKNKLDFHIKKGEAIEKLSNNNQENCKLESIITKLEQDIETANMHNTFQIGIALKVLEDRLWDVDNKLAQRCNDLQHKILGDD